MRARLVFAAAALAASAAQAGAAPSTAATPTFAPAAGTYNAPRTVTISDTTPGAKIYYTTNGTTPTTSSTLYSGPITVSATTTVKAIAAATGYSNSAVGSATYTLVVATPTFSPVAGTYNAPQTVTISDSTPGAKIYVTTNGTTPTTSSTLYSGPITVGPTTTVKAIAAATNYTNSAVASATYTMVAASPTFSPGGGTYNGPQTVTITDTTPGAKIYYTTNGNTPSKNSTLYSAPVTVSATTTVKAIAIATGYTDSAVASAVYALAAAPPTFAPGPGTYGVPPQVCLSDATPGASIYYTTDGTTPTTSSTLFTYCIDVSTTTTIRAIAAATGYANSTVASATYTIAPFAATPTFSPTAGTYSTPQTVAIMETTPGATVYFTTDDTTPTTGSTRYGGPFLVAAPMTVKAIATAPGYATSAVASASYRINPAPPPRLNPRQGFYPGPLNVVLSDDAPGAQIYFTTDRTIPTTTSPRYTGLIPVADGTLLYAVATAPGYSVSDVAGGWYFFPATTPDGIATEFSITSRSSEQTQAFQFSTSSPDSLLLAFASVGGPAGTGQDIAVSGDIQWTRLETANAQAGAAGIWWAVAPFPLTNSTVSASVGVPGYTQALTVVALAGAHLAPGTSLSASSATGAPTLTLLSSSAGSWFYGVGIDPTTATPRSLGDYQTLVADVPDVTGHAYGWIQQASNPTTAVGASVTMKVVAPIADAWNFAAVEVLPRVLPPPAISPGPGTYDRPQTVVLSATVGSEIHYTLDGTTPTTASPLYTFPLTVSNATVVKAIASGAGFSTSAVAQASYAIVPVLVGISVQAPSTTVSEGSVEQCNAIGAYTDGSSRDFTSQIAWASSNSSVATITAGGAVTGVHAGTTTISATTGGVTGTLPLTVGLPASTYYCYDGAGNMTARLYCPSGIDCSTRCP
jgi:hypothetical protein